MRSSFMKKTTCSILCLLIILSTAFCLAGCKTRTDEMADQEIYAEKQINTVNKKIAKCINTKDKKGLKSLFSKSAQENSEEIDGKINNLINIFDGVKIKSIDGEEPGFSGDFNTQPINICGSYTINLNNGKKYVMWVQFCSMDDENKENVGLYMIEMITCTEDKLPSGFKWDGINSGNSGIFIHYIN